MCCGAAEERQNRGEGAEPQACRGEDVEGLRGGCAFLRARPGKNSELEVFLQGTRSEVTTTEGCVNFFWCKKGRGVV